jgi:myo-inositol-1(or 4)-monophosphatase
MLDFIARTLYPVRTTNKRPTMHPMLNTAIRAAREAGEIIRRNIDRLDRVRVEAKGERDFVTSLDLEVEAHLIESIKQTYPQHRVVSEEANPDYTYDADNQHPTWIIDPIDGSLNLSRGLPHFAISMAWQDKGSITVGLVYDPLREEIFAAAKGEGATLNNMRLRIKKPRPMHSCLIGTGFPVRDPDLLPKQLQEMSNLLPKVCDIRRAGSAALDLAYVACGRLDGYWERGLKTWDIAAGSLIAQEAGAICLDLKGGNDFLTTGSIISCHKTLMADLVRATKP